MGHYRRSSHTVYDIKYHLVWIAKYRRPVLRGEVGERVRELIREICKTNDVEIISGQFRHITDEVIMKYIEEQGKEPSDGDFRVDGEL